MVLSKDRVLRSVLRREEVHRRRSEGASKAETHPLAEYGSLGVHPSTALGVFRMGAPESAQNSKCGPIQTQFPTSSL